MAGCASSSSCAFPSWRAAGCVAPARSSRGGRNDRQRAGALVLSDEAFEAASSTSHDLARLHAKLAARRPSPSSRGGSDRRPGLSRPEKGAAVPTCEPLVAPLRAPARRAAAHVAMKRGTTARTQSVAPSASAARPWLVEHAADGSARVRLRRGRHAHRRARGAQGGRGRRAARARGARRARARHPERRRCRPRRCRARSSRRRARPTAAAQPPRRRRPAPRRPRDALPNIRRGGGPGVACRYGGVASSPPDRFGPSAALAGRRRARRCGATRSARAGIVVRAVRRLPPRLLGPPRGRGPAVPRARARPGRRRVRGGRP